jgi:hypothetical protein
VGIDERIILRQIFQKYVDVRTWNGLNYLKKDPNGGVL